MWRILPAPAFNRMLDRCHLCCAKEPAVCLAALELPTKQPLTLLIRSDDDDDGDEHPKIVQVNLGMMRVNFL